MTQYPLCLGCKEEDDRAARWLGSKTTWQAAIQRGNACTSSFKPFFFGDVRHLVSAQVPCQHLLDHARLGVFLGGTSSILRTFLGKRSFFHYWAEPVPYIELFWVKPVKKWPCSSCSWILLLLARGGYVTMIVSFDALRACSWICQWANVGGGGLWFTYRGHKRNSFFYFRSFSLKQDHLNTLWSPFPEIFAELRKLQASALLLVWVWGRSESLVGHKIFYEGFSGCNLIILYQVTDKVQLCRT